MKKFPTPMEKILPAALMLVIASGCQSSTASVEASTTRVPVVAPAGAVLRVRLKQALDSVHSRPGDRFSGVLDAAVMAGGIEILPKGTWVQGHVVTAHEAGSGSERAVLAVTLDSYERDGKQIGLETSPLRRTNGHPTRNWTWKKTEFGPMAEPEVNKDQNVLMPAETIIGFTLKSGVGI